MFTLRMMIVFPCCLIGRIRYSLLMIYSEDESRADEEELLFLFL